MLICILFFLQCPTFLNGVQTGTIQDSGLNELSGLVASRFNPGVLWTHNDSGGDASVYAVNHQGFLLATIHLARTSVLDVEDIALGKDPIDSSPVLFLGDIGDNNAVRPHITIYQISEPIVYKCQNTTGALNFSREPLRYHYTYPDGPRDAETLLFDPQASDLFIVSKRDFPVGHLYRLPKPWIPDAFMELEYILDIQIPFPVGGDVSFDGTAIILKNYLQPFQDNALIWERQTGSSFWSAFSISPCNALLIQEPQGEAIAFDPLTYGYLTTSEGSNQPLYFFEPETAWGTTLIPVYPGDFNGDNLVDGADRSQLKIHWRSYCNLDPLCLERDLIKDGRINVLDFIFHINLEIQAQCLAN